MALPRILIVVCVELAILAGLAVWLIEVDANGPRRIDARLADGRTAILYLPHPAQNSTATANAQASRPLPVAILVSGLGAGPSTMASLGRRLAHNGYASLAIGIPLAHFASAGTEVYDDIAAAVDYARASKLVDGSRAVLIGHSAGAGAVTVYATRDHAIGGVILISGGCYLNAGDRLPDALFVFTSRDPEGFRDSCHEVVKNLRVPSIHDLPKSMATFIPVPRSPKSRSMARAIFPSSVRSAPRRTSSDGWTESSRLSGSTRRT